MTTQKKVPTRYFIAVLIICGLFEQMTWLPELSLLEATGDVISAVLLASLLQAVLLLPLYCYLRQDGKVEGGAGKTTAVIYGIYFLAAAVYILFCGYLFLSRSVMPKTHGLVLIALVLASGIYIAARDTAAVMKTGSFFATGSILVTLLFFLLSLPQIDIAEVYILPQDNNMSVWQAAIHGALRSQIAPILLVLMDTHQKKQEHVLAESWLGIFILFSLIGIATSAVLGIVAQMALFPPFMQITTVQIYSVFQRMDVIWIAGWGMALLTVLSTLIHCSKRCFDAVMTKGWMVLYGGLAAGAAGIYWYAEQETLQTALRQCWGIPLVQLIFCFFVPCLLLLIRKFQQKYTNTVQKGKK